MTTAIMNEDLLQDVIHAAEGAGAAALAFYKSEDLSVTRKADASPLTLADLASHQYITAALEKISSFPILSEESESVPYEQRRHWGAYWLIDPLDGTKEFIKQNGEFTVNIALIERGTPVLGVVYAPALGETYAAARGLGARKSTGSGWHPIRCAAYRKDKLRIVASRSHGNEKVERFLERIPAEQELLSCGSSLKLCMVADGRADLYPRLGPTMEWDTAAAHAVVLEAGGMVSDLEGRAVIYNKENLLNPEFIVTGSPPFPWQPYLT